VSTQLIDAPRAWSPDDVATYLGISRRHLDDIRAEDDTFPAPRRLGRLPRWTPDVIRAWVDAAAAQPEPVRPPKRKAGQRVL